MARQSEVKAECSPAAVGSQGRRPFGIHLSAVVACVCFVAGTMLAVLAAPALLPELLDGGTGAYVLLVGLAGFFVIVAVIQRHMGISLRASQTETPDQLCTSGPFKYSRNPIYLAFILPLAALAYFSPLSAAVAIGLYVLTMTQFVIRDEERTLRSKFGAAYEDYSRRTPRWIFI
jgi:protein-S-isoprenylcysteine O-methyltransferase Ste14